MADDPIRLGEIIRRGARAARRGAPGKQRRYGSALGVSKSTASRHLNGEDAYSPVTHLLRAVDALARGTHTSAVPILIEGFATVMERLNQRQTPDLERRWRELAERRIELRGQLERAQLIEQEHGKPTAAVDEAILAISEIDVEIVAIRRLLRERAEREGR